MLRSGAPSEKRGVRVVAGSWCREWEASRKHPMRPVEVHCERQRDGQGTSQGSAPSPGVDCSICGACHKAPPSFARCGSEILDRAKRTGPVVHQPQACSACGGRLFRGSLLPCPTPPGAAKETGMMASLKIDESMARRRPSNCFALCLLWGDGTDGALHRAAEQGSSNFNKRWVQNEHIEDFLGLFGHFGSGKG